MRPTGQNFTDEQLLLLLLLQQQSLLLLQKMHLVQPYLPTQ
jgi:hypothetical protein